MSIRLDQQDIDKGGATYSNIGPGASHLNSSTTPIQKGIHDVGSLLRGTLRGVRWTCWVPLISG